MGSWGITAFQSDAGLDAVIYIRKNALPENGKMELGKIIEEMKKEQWVVPDVKNCESHTGPMALAEIIMQYQNHDLSRLYRDDEICDNYKQFKDMTSFTADKDSVKWLRDYISDTLKNRIKGAEYAAKNSTDDWDQWGGWFEEKNWIGWQNHMKTLVNSMDELLSSPDEMVELIEPQEQTEGSVMQM